ncbi:MAG TPA: right-handed parallel beta-helix repeat-containing protein [Candidatus Hydrogenedentes bacterium]|nr:right-handed parallel beta-helix repeat-containing protein [Candidatus Hydrogenedentota bacterium]
MRTVLKRSAACAAILTTFSLVTTLHASGAEFYVSPDGRDDGRGTEKAPFRSLERARDAVRALNGGMSEDIVVWLRDGVYRLEQPFRLASEDSGMNGHQVVYKAYAGEKPVLSGGIRVTSWRQGERGLWTAAVDLADCRQLFVDGRRAVRARGDCPEGVERFGAMEFIDADAGHVFPQGTGDMARWRNHGDIELGYYNSWSHMICKVESITADEQGRAVYHMQRPWFFLASMKEGVQAQSPAYIENAFELLDEPGEWYFDRPAKTLYYMPREGEDMAGAEVIVPRLETLLRIEGAVGNPAHDIRFEGVAFAEATWLRPNRSGHADVQANFICDDTNLFPRGGTLVNVQNEHRKSPANVVLHGAVGCSFERCSFARLGGAGIDIERGSQENVVNGCEFHDISGSAVQVGDVTRDDHHPDDPRLVVKDNRITNNFIHDIGVEFQDSIGVFAGYTEGTVIAHNEIRDLPYSGISVGWGWGEPDAGGGGYPTPYKYEKGTPCANNRIENNHIHHVMQARNDGGGVYTLSNQPGTVIRGNHIHDNGPGGPGGIYLDEGSGFIEITGNAVYRVATPMNYNNRVQNRTETCNEHDNFFGIEPGAEGFPVEVADGAGPETAYREAITP